MASRGSDAYLPDDMKNAPEVYFDDGSTSIERYRGEARVSADGKRTTVEGTFECVGGTGRSAGLNGQGTYRGERLGALQTGDYVYVDTTGSCTVP